MTQKEKYLQLDKELRPKYEHLSDYEYQQIRAQHIKSRRRKIHWKFFFRGLMIPAVVGILLLVMLVAFTEGKVASFLILLLTISIAIWFGVELCRHNMDLGILPSPDAALLTSELTYKQLSRVIGGPWKWQTGKYHFVIRRAITKNFDKGGIEDSDTYRLFFDNPNGKQIEYCVTESVYDDMKTGDLYYLVLRKTRTGKENVLRCYKTEFVTLDDKLKVMLQE